MTFQTISARAAPNNSSPSRYCIIANIGSLTAHNYAFNQPGAGTNGELTILSK